MSAVVAAISANFMRGRIMDIESPCFVVYGYSGILWKSGQSGKRRRTPARPLRNPDRAAETGYRPPPEVVA
jgi:hypothetical protein